MNAVSVLPVCVAPSRADLGPPQGSSSPGRERPACPLSPPIPSCHNYWEAPMQNRPQPMSPRTLKLNPRDNVLLAVDGVAQGVAVAGITAAARILRGHKMACAPIAKGQPILKFGQIIGFATEDIALGAHVHTHNCSF